MVDSSLPFVIFTHLWANDRKYSHRPFICIHLQWRKNKANTDDDEIHVERVMSYEMNRKFSSRKKREKKNKMVGKIVYVKCFGNPFFHSSILSMLRKWSETWSRQKVIHSNAPNSVHTKDQNNQLHAMKTHLFLLLLVLLFSLSNFPNNAKTTHNSSDWKLVRAVAWHAVSHLICCNSIWSRRIVHVDRWVCVCVSKRHMLSLSLDEILMTPIQN